MHKQIAISNFPMEVPHNFTKKSSPDRVTSAEANELKQEGIVRNNADLVRQAIGVLYQKEVDQKLKTLRLRTLEQTEEEC